MVIISKEEKRAVYTYILREGTIVVKKDSYLPKHQHLDVANVKVQMILKSLKSRGFVNDVFSWMWSYYTVTNAGVAFLVKELGFSSDVVPATYKKKRVISAPKVEDEGEGKVEQTPEGGETE